MSAVIPDSAPSISQLHSPRVHISYECISHAHARESDTFHYEIACSIHYPVASGHLSIKVTGRNTYRNTAARDVPFTTHKEGATTYVELQEGEHLEVRVVELDGTYSRAFYQARRQELTEQNVRRTVSIIERIDAE